MSKLSQAWGAAKLALDAKAPTLLMAGGIVVMGVAAVVACKKTLDLEEKGGVHAAMDEIERIGVGNNEKEAQDARLKLYGQIGSEVARTYALPVLLFAGGAGMVIKSHGIMQQRNAALAVAFTTLKKSFDAYRARVVQDMGHEADQHYLNGSQPMKLNGMMVSSRDWEESGKDPYNRVFSQETSSRWENDLGTNKHFIQCQQRFAQQLLNRRGYLYLSDVYTSLGLPESDVSRVVGWKVDTLPDGSQNIPVVDFGIDKPLPEDWKYNQQRAVFLDFNCNGLIVGGKIQKAIEAAQAA
jgi:hypothetical protein